MTRLRTLRRMTIAYFAAYAFFVTFPGVFPFRGPRLSVFGLPLPLVWVTLWVIGGFVVLFLLDRAYSAAETGE